MLVTCTAVWLFEQLLPSDYLPNPCRARSRAAKLREEPGGMLVLYRCFSPADTYQVHLFPRDVSRLPPIQYANANCLLQRYVLLRWSIRQPRKTTEVSHTFAKDQDIGKFKKLCFGSTLTDSLGMKGRRFQF